MPEIRRFARAAIVLLLCFVSSPAFRVNAADGSASVHVRVVVERTASPIANAYVALYAPDDTWHQPSAEAVATHGTVTLRARPEVHRLFASAKGYQSAEQRLDITSESRHSITIALLPEYSLSGSVRDPEGNAIASARVSVVSVALSELARRHGNLQQGVSTGADGRWTLPLPPERAVPLMIEAAGFAPAWHIARPERHSSPVDLVLGRGGRLRIRLDRTDPGMLLTLAAVPAAKEAAVPTGWQKVVWERTAVNPLVEWTALEAGTYRVIAQTRDRSTRIVTDTGTVVVEAGATTEHRVTLPRTSRPAEVTSLSISLDRGEATLRVVPEDVAVPLPASGEATFRDCRAKGSFRLPVGVAKDGAITVPVPVDCRTLVLRLSPFASLVVPVATQRGMTKSLGEFPLSAAAEAEVRVRREPTAGTVGGAMVRAWLRLDDEREVLIDDWVADESGIAILSGLPAGATIRVEAREERTLATVSVSITPAPGERLVIDPLAIADPAVVTIAPRLSSQFRKLVPKARIISVVLEPEPGNDRVARADSLDEKGSVVFFDVRPGRWQPRVVVDAADTAQPIDLEPVDLAAGENRKLEPELEPLLFEGRIIARDRTAEWSLAVADRPGPHSIRRRVLVRPDLTFRVVLPRRDVYDVSVRAGRDGGDVAIGDVAFDDPARAVSIVVPEGSLTVRVRDGERPATAVPVMLTLRRDAADGIREVTRRAETDSAGTVRFTGLTKGRWLARASTADHRIAERAAAVDGETESHLDLDLQPSSMVSGVVRDARGQGVARARIDCLFPAAAGANVAGTETAADGRFALALADLPPILRCGVTTPAGAIGAYAVRSGESADLTLPSASGSLTIADWGTRLPQGNLWMVASDGRVLALSAIGGKLGRLWAPLIVPSFPAGTWRVVRVNTADELAMLAGGMPGSAEVITVIRLEADGHEELNVYREAPQGDTERRDR